MQNQTFILISVLLLTLLTHASEMNMDVDSTYCAKELNALVRIMKNENRTVSWNDRWSVRTARNLHRCCKNPLEFFELGCCADIHDKTNDRIYRQEALLAYIMARELTLNQKNIFDFGMNKGIQLRNAFEKDQREQCKWYMKERDRGTCATEVEEAAVCCGCSCIYLGIFSALELPMHILLTPFCIGAASLFLHTSERL